MLRHEEGRLNVEQIFRVFFDNKPRMRCQGREITQERKSELKVSYEREVLRRGNKERRSK